MNLDMPTIITLIALMVVSYSLRAYFYIKQSNSVMDELRRIKKVWPNHAMGRGATRTAKGIVILGADEDLVVREAMVLSGMTVFSRMKPCEALLEHTVEELAGITDKTEPPKGVKKATWRAAGVAAKFITDTLAKRAAALEEKTAEADPEDPGKETL